MYGNGAGAPVPTEAAIDIGREEKQGRRGDREEGRKEGRQEVRKGGRDEGRQGRRTEGREEGRGGGRDGRRWDECGADENHMISTLTARKSS